MSAEDALARAAQEAEAAGPLWTSDELARATGGMASSPFSVSGVAYDSREVGPGDLFVALKGEHTDGHKFIEQAFASGGEAAVVLEPVEHVHLLVTDTTVALEAMGRAARARTDATIVGVTGSVGKTGTKEALALAFGRIAPGRTHRSVKSYNNHVGVPLSLSRMPRESRFAVFEMGMNHPGELSALTRLVRPHIALVTAIAPAHRAFFDSVEAIADAKAEIFEGLEPGGTAILPHDSPYRGRLLAGARRTADRILTFGTGEGADVRAIEAVPAPGGGSLVTARFPDRQLSFTISQPGAHWVSNALAVLAAVHAAGGDIALAGLALAEMEGLAGRGARRQVTVGEGQALLIDESYNANPVSMAATIGQLGQERAARRIAVLGAMKELGDSSDDYHAALAEPLIADRVDHVILVGEEMTPLAQRLAGRIDFDHGADADEARESLRAILRPGDAVLIKGSNSVGLARVVSALAGGET